jgi:hypothetical protein
MSLTINQEKEFRRSRKVALQADLRLELFEGLAQEVKRYRQLQADVGQSKAHERKQALETIDKLLILLGV